MKSLANGDAVKTQNIGVEVAAQLLDLLAHGSIVRTLTRKDKGHSRRHILYRVNRVVEFEY